MTVVGAASASRPVGGRGDHVALPEPLRAAAVDVWPGWALAHGRTQPC